MASFISFGCYTSPGKRCLPRETKKIDLVICCEDVVCLAGKAACWLRRLLQWVVLLSAKTYRCVSTCVYPPRTSMRGVPSCLGAWLSNFALVLAGSGKTRRLTRSLSCQSRRSSCANIGGSFLISVDDPSGRYPNPSLYLAVSRSVYLCLSVCPCLPLSVSLSDHVFLSTTIFLPPSSSVSASICQDRV